MTCGHSGDMLDQIQAMKSGYYNTCDVCGHSKPHGKYQRWCNKRKHSVSLKAQCSEFKEKDEDE